MELLHRHKPQLTADKDSVASWQRSVEIFVCPKRARNCQYCSGFYARMRGQSAEAPTVQHRLLSTLSEDALTEQLLSDTDFAKLLADMDITVRENYCLL